MKVYNVYKKLGQTPLEALEAFRKKKGITQSSKLTYAGRLDPMAKGVLLILQGATQAEREKYMGLGKKYKAKIVLGFGTDSFDLLGLPTPGVILSVSASEREESINLQKLRTILKSYCGKIILPIPPYSSVIYKGRPLFMSARDKSISNGDLPKREMEIKAIKLLGFNKISSVAILKQAEAGIKKVKGDFRQERIIKAWRSLLGKKEQNYQTIEIEVSCASGTYIRSLANEIGKRLNTKSFLFSLERLSVGKYRAKESIRI